MSEQAPRTGIDELDPSTRAAVRAVIDAAVPVVTPALAVSVWQGGRRRFEADAGWFDPQRMARPVAWADLWDLASLTKLFTTTALLRLVAAGRVELDEPIAELVREFGASGPRPVDGGQDPLTWELLPMPAGRGGWRVDPTVVTIRQLLTHTSGLAPWHSVFEAAGPVPPPPDIADPVSAGARWHAALEAIGAYPFVSRPGEEFHYSDLGFMLLGVALGRVHGAGLAAAIRELVAEPLGLDSLTYTPLTAGRPRATVVPTELDARWRERRCWGEVDDENTAGLGGISGHAGLFATVDDVARLGEAWRVHDERLGLSRCFDEAVRLQTRGLGAARGLGWQVQPTDHLAPLGHGAYGHTGFTGTSLAVDPDREMVVALCTNRVYHGRDPAGIAQLRLDLHQALAGATPSAGAPS